MNKTQQMAYSTATAMADAAIETVLLVTDKHIQIDVVAEPAGLRYVVWSNHNGAMESVRLLASATSLERLSNTVAAFVANL